MMVVTARKRRTGYGAAREVITVPNQRFFDNRCTACAMGDAACAHIPFGRLFDWQTQWLTAFDEGRARLSHLEIHRRGRKTATALNLQFRECDRFPKTRQAYVGPCYDDMTEILTDRGWKLFADLGEEAVACLEDDELVYRKPVNKFVFPHDGLMIGAKNMFCDMLVTPNHRCYVQRNCHGSSKRGPWEIKTVEEIEGSGKYIIRHDFRWNGDDSGSANWFEFLGFYFAEGCARLRDHNTEGRAKIKKKKGPDWSKRGEIVLAQKKYKTYAEDLLKRNNFEIHRSDSATGKSNYYIYDTKLASEFVSYGNSRTKTIPAYIRQASARLIRCFLRGYWMGDGSFSDGPRRSKCGWTVSTALAGDIQELILKAGGTANVHPKSCGSYPSGWYITWLTDRHHTSRISEKDWYRKEYHGNVYCVQVPHGIVLVRRNGIAYWCGNTFAEARRIVWDDPTMLREALPDPRVLSWKLNEQHMIVKFGNGSVWQCFGGDDPDNLRGVDAQGFVFDEWSQQNEKCWTEILQPIFRQDPSRWAAFLYTPFGYNHATRMFDHACYVDEGEVLPTNGAAARCRPGMFALRLCADHSGIFSREELAAVKADPNTTAEIYAQEYLCARVADEQFALITSAMMNDLAAGRERPTLARAIIACDPSMGGDACAIDVQWAYESVLHRSFRTRDTMRIAGELRKISDETGILDFIVDSIGIGAGVAHALAEDRRYQVQAFNSGEQASSPARFANKRAEMWWRAREDVMGGDCCRPDEETCRQVPFGSRYKVGGNGRIQIIDKDIIRRELGRSPDDAEAWAMGRYGIRNARECVGRMVQHVAVLPCGRSDSPYAGWKRFKRGKFARRA